MIQHIKSNPFLDPLLNKIEIFNELSFVLCTYLCLTFTDYMIDMKIKYGLGYIAIIIALLNVLVNIINLLVMNIKQIINKIQLIHQRCKRKKLNDQKAKIYMSN